MRGMGTRGSSTEKTRGSRPRRADGQCRALRQQRPNRVYSVQGTSVAVQSARGQLPAERLEKQARADT